MAKNPAVHKSLSPPAIPGHSNASVLNSLPGSFREASRLSANTSGHSTIAN
jgi:hypothetical protein